MRKCDLSMWCYTLFAQSRVQTMQTVCQTSHALSLQYTFQFMTYNTHFSLWHTIHIWVYDTFAMVKVITSQYLICVHTISSSFVWVCVCKCLILVLLMFHWYSIGSKCNMSWGSWVSFLDWSILCVYLLSEAPPTCCYHGDSPSWVSCW